MAGIFRRDGVPVRETRGGVAGGAVVTGVVVAFGAMFLLSAIVGGVLVALDATEATVTESEAVQAGIGAGIALVVAQFLSYLWGGYTAGRMARGAGVANGVLVPIVALVVGAGVVGLVAVLGGDANLNLPFSTNRLPLDESNVVDWGVGIGVAALVAMFLGGMAGGALGARWHTKLEQAAHDDDHASAHTVVVNDRRADSTVDLTDRDHHDATRR
jgi:mannitol-specific phosphotransferase system IIBC component